MLETWDTTLLVAHPCVSGTPASRHSSRSHYLSLAVLPSIPTPSKYFRLSSTSVKLQTSYSPKLQVGLE